LTQKRIAQKGNPKENVGCHAVCFLVYIFHSSAARWWVAFVTGGMKLNVLTTVDSREFISLALAERTHRRFM
jgi:hypothetical protein